MFLKSLRLTNLDAISIQLSHARLVLVSSNPDLQQRLGTDRQPHTSQQQLLEAGGLPTSAEHHQVPHGNWQAWLLSQYIGSKSTTWQIQDTRVHWLQASSYLSVRLFELVRRPSLICTLNNRYHACRQVHRQLRCTKA